MSTAERFPIGSYCTAKAIHVLHLSECTRRYGSEKKTKVLSGEVIETRNNPTESGRASWCVRARYHLGEGQTKLAEINVRSVKKADRPAIRVEEPETPVALPVNRRAMVDAVAVVVAPLALESELDANADPPPALPPASPSAPPLPPLPLAAPPPSLPLPPLEIAAMLPVPEAPPPALIATPIAPIAPADIPLSTNHGYEWYKYNNPDHLPINGPLRGKRWGIRLSTGDRLDASGDINHERSPMDYFFLSFPIEQTNLTIRLTNTKLHTKGKKELDRKEFYKFL
jgi:hypothetical protein